MSERDTGLRLLRAAIGVVVALVQVPRRSGSPQGVWGDDVWAHPAAGHRDRHTPDTRATTAPGATHDAKKERLI